MPKKEKKIARITPKLSDEVAEIKKAFAKSMAHFTRDFESIKTQHEKFTTQVMEWIREGRDALKSHETVLGSVKNTNENAEEILGNVLLAIRQNEYLQAWYPAQSGFPEIKVSGIHPLNIESKQKEKI